MALFQKIISTSAPASVILIRLVVRPRLGSFSSKFIRKPPSLNAIDVTCKDVLQRKNL